MTRGRVPLREIALAAAVVLLAAFLRLYRLDALPPGLHYDEAFNATEAQKVLAGVERPLFFRGDLTEEPMAIYTTAVVFGLAGASPWSLRLVSALVGVLTVAALYLLARALLQSHLLALLAAFVLAILYWHINFSRLGMEPIFLPLMLTLFLAFLWRGLRSGSLPPSHVGETMPRPLSLRALTGRVRLLDFALAGFFLGATQYTYKSALAVPLLVAAFFGVELVVDRAWVRLQARGLVICALVAVLVFAPLGLYFLTHPGEFLERPSAVTASTLNAQTLVDHTFKVAGMFLVQGDDNPRSNLPGRPALDLFLALGFVAGIVGCLWRLRQRESRLLCLWLLVMALPSVLTDFAPHFGRSIGTTPAIALVVARGFGWLFQKLPLSRAAVGGIMLVGLAASLYATGGAYFGEWGARTGLFDSFDVGHLSLAQALHDRPAAESIYLSPVEQDHYTIQFGLEGRAARSFDGRRVLVLPPPGVPAVYGIATREDTRSLERLTEIFPGGRVVASISDFTGAPFASLWRAEGAPRIAPQRTVQAQLGEAIHLIGYDLHRASDSLALTLYWKSVAVTRLDYTVFVHLVGGLQPETGSPVWAQDDAPPGHGTYPTTQWRAGQVVIDDYRLAIPANAPRGEYAIETGMYILTTGARARVLDAAGAPMENDRVLLERISLP